MSELTFQSLANLAVMIRRHSVSPVDVLNAFLERIERLNPRLNAIVSHSADSLAQAKAAEAAVLRGDKLGALHGVPVTIKDTIETAGLRTTSGSTMRAEFVPEKDATAVARLKAAGAIILGKTNSAEMAMDYNADNPVFGRTNNPFDYSRTPGGSSGGEAAAISACLSPGGVGSDLAGSIRIPAHFCGIVGLKPGATRVPSDGQFPPSIGPYSLGSAIGPLARYIEDLDLLFDVLIANPAGSRVSPENSLDNYRKTIRGQRVAWYTDDSVTPVTDETRRAVKAAARALADAGLKVEEICPPGIDQGYILWLKLFSRASVIELREHYSGREPEGGAFVRWRLATADDAPPPTLDEYIYSWRERDRLRARLVEWMKDIPLLVAPVGATAALKHGANKVTVEGKTFGAFRAFSYSQAFNVFDLPAVSIPGGRSAEGLPIGVQVVGPPLGEKSVLAAASIVEVALGGWQQPAQP